MNEGERVGDESKKGMGTDGVGPGGLWRGLELSLLREAGVKGGLQAEEGRELT